MLTRLFSGKGLALGGSISLPCQYKHGDRVVTQDMKWIHSPAKELDFIVSSDKIPSACGDECYIIASSWIKRWMEYGKGNADLKSVGPIDSSHLVELDGDKLAMRSDIESKTDYRCVNKVMWYVQ